MTVKIEVEKVSESYQIVCGLLERREWESEHGRSCESIDNILEQFVGTSAGVLLEDWAEDRPEFWVCPGCGAVRRDGESGPHADICDDLEDWEEVGA